MRELECDVAVIGGGLGGVAAAIAALDRGLRVVLTVDCEWVGGQLTSQGVPPDEHIWVEDFGITRRYRALREGIRDYYRENYPLTDAARRRPDLNPGDGTVSRICHEPRVAHAVLAARLMPYEASARLQVLRRVRAVDAEVTGDTVDSVVVENLSDGERSRVVADYFLDATELGDVLPLTGTAFVSGAESRAETGEPHAPAVADPENVQSIAWCFAFDHVDGDHTIPRPADYDHWRTFELPFWGAPMLSFIAPDPRTLEPVSRTLDVNAPVTEVGDPRFDAVDRDLWRFRRIASRSNFVDDFYESDIVLANWPQLDYVGGSVIEPTERDRHLAAAKAQARSYFYWLQTDAPRPDGGTGWPGLRLRGDVLGTDDGFAQSAYIRESRRIRAQFTIREQDISVLARGSAEAVSFPASVGIGMYRIDLHPSTGGDNYIDVECCPFEIPLGALVPVSTNNLLASAKNIGTTHITNGAYRLHPVEWNIGEAAGELAAFCLQTSKLPREVCSDEELVAEFQARLIEVGVQIHWPDIVGY